VNGGGLVALGDSITRGRGEPMLGVHVQSWAQWLAEALEVSYTALALDGALARDLLHLAHRRLADGYAFGCLYVGVNDARSVSWDPIDFEGRVDTLLALLLERCERVVICTLPRDLGRPTAAPKPAAANAIIRVLAARYGAVVVALDDFGGWLRVLPDAVHPTALGQVEIAERAARALGAPSPRRLAAPDLSRSARARWALRYAVLLSRDVWRRFVERVRLLRVGA
jgi:lysophospholipase L1-like esterase